jgi:hypothetical protein
MTAVKFDYTKLTSIQELAFADSIVERVDGVCFTFTHDIIVPTSGTQSILHTNPTVSISKSDIDWILQNCADGSEAATSYIKEYMEID